MASQGQQQFEFQYQTGHQQCSVPPQSWGVQQPMSNFSAQQQFGDNQQYSNTSGGQEQLANDAFMQQSTSIPQLMGGQQQNTIAQQPLHEFGEQQGQNMSQHGGGQYSSYSNNAFIQQATSGPQVPSGQQLHFNHHMGAPQQPNIPTFPGGQQPFANSSQQQATSSFYSNQAQQQLWNGQQTQGISNFPNMLQQPFYNQQPFNVLPFHASGPQSFASGPSTSSMQYFTAGQQQYQLNHQNSTPQHQQGFGQQLPPQIMPQGGFPPQPVSYQQVYGVQQNPSIQQSLLSQDFSQSVNSPSHADNDGYFGDDEEDYDGDVDEEEVDSGNNEVQVNFITPGHGPPDGLMSDPIYQQTIQKVNALQNQFDISPKNSAVAMPALYPPKTKHKRTPEEAGRLDFDEDDLEEAVREAKRRRFDSGPKENFNNAQKVFIETGGGPVRPLLSEAMDQDEPEFDGLDLDFQILGLGPEFKGVHDGAMLSLAKPRHSHVCPPLPEPEPRDPSFRLLESACSSFWLMIEITKHLRVKDLVNLYSVSRTFHCLVNSRFQSTITAWAQHISPAGWKVFYWKFYGKYTIQDPSGLTWAAPGPVAFPRPPWDVKPRVASNKNIRRVPSLKYLAMLEQRETRTRDILACLARAGHRLPKTMHVTLKKIWLLMDCATNAQRRGFIHNPDLWTDRDLYNAQMFFIKLHMRFNEPIFGPNSPLLADTFLGSKDGLTPLWKLLRRKAYIDPVKAIQQRLRYWAPAEDVDHWRLIGGSGKAYWGIPPGELGEEHKEGWGAGHLHLKRPDELVVEECVRREIEMQEHIIFMVFWGHVDFQKRLNLIPTEEEMYISDDEDEPPLPAYGPFSRTGTFGKCGNVPFEYDNWQPKHAMKARWKTLTRAEKLWVVKDDDREQEDALVWEEDGNGFWNEFNVNDYPDPEEEDEQEALRRNKPNLNYLETRVLHNYDDVKAHGEEIDYFDIISLSGSSDSFFDPVVVTGEPELDPEYRKKMEEERKKQEEEERSRQEQPIEYVYEEEEIPPIPDNVTDPLTIANWNDMDPYLHGVVIQEHNRLALQDRKEKRTLLYLQRQEEKKKKEKQQQEEQAKTRKQAEGEEQVSSSTPPTTPRYHYEYPSITDPHLLSMLRRYDRFPPEAFGDQFPPSPEETPHENPEREDWEDTDDEGLQALADIDYDSEELDFDVDMYQKFLDRVGDNGSFQPRQATKGEGESEEEEDENEGVAKHKGKGKAQDGEDGEDTIMMASAHEADVLDEDDDIPFPKYEFRHF